MIERGDLETRPPSDGESLYGYLADVVAQNDLSRVGLIDGTANGPRHRPWLTNASVDELRAVADVLEVDVAHLVHRTYPVVPGDPGRRAFFGTTIARADLQTQVRRFSPAALAHRPFHRAMWQLRIPFDIETGEMLACTCRDCGRTQRWRHTAGIAFCDGCGESLAQETAFIDAALLPDVAMAVGLTHTSPETRAASLAALPDEISTLGPAAAFEMLLRLVPVVKRDCVWTSSDRLWSNDPHRIAAGMQRAWRVLRSWPQAMTDMISRDLATSEKRHTDGNRGATMRFLRLRDHAYLPPALRGVIARLHDSIDLSGPNGADLRSGTMTCREVAKLLGQGTAQIAALRRQGVLRTTGLVKADRMAPTFDRTEILEIDGNYRRRCSLNRAAAVLGLPYYAIEQLAALRHLPILAHPYFAARFPAPQTTEDALKELIDELDGGKSPRHRHSVPLRRAMQMVGGRLKPWDAVVEAMLTGNLHYSLDDGPGPLFERIRVTVVDLRPHVAALITRGHVGTSLSTRIDPAFAFRPTMPKIDAAEVLNLATKQSTDLLSCYPSTRTTLVPIVDVLALAEEFVSNVEIAARLSVSPQAVRSAACRIGVRQSSKAGYNRLREAEIVAELVRRSSEAGLRMPTARAEEARAGRIPAGAATTRGHPVEQSG